jgi:hypothetical protein
VSRIRSTSTITFHRARTLLDATFDHPRLRISTLFSKCLAERESLLVGRQAPRTLRGRPKSPTARRPVCRSVYCFVYTPISQWLLRPIAIFRICDGFKLRKLYLSSHPLPPPHSPSLPFSTCRCLEVAVACLEFLVSSHLPLLPIVLIFPTLFDQHGLFCTFAKSHLCLTSFASSHVVVSSAS